MLTPVLGLRLVSGVVCCTAGVVTLLDVSAGSGVLVSVVSVFRDRVRLLPVVPAMLSLMPGWRGSSAGRVSAVLNVFAIMLLVTPPARAWETAQVLPEGFARALVPKRAPEHGTQRIPEMHRLSSPSLFAQSNRDPSATSSGW